MFSLTDKVALLDLHKKNPKLGCRPLAELIKETCNIKIDKSQIAKIIKNECNIRKEYENFEGDMKRKKIKFEDQINNICRKASAKISALSRIALYMDLPKRKQIMNAFFKSISK